MKDADELLVTIQVRLPREVVERADHFRSNMPLAPSRAKTMRWLVEYALGAMEKQPELSTVKQGF